MKPGYGWPYVGVHRDKLAAAVSDRPDGRVIVHVLNCSKPEYGIYSYNVDSAYGAVIRQKLANVENAGPEAMHQAIGKAWAELRPRLKDHNDNTVKQPN